MQTIFVSPEFPLNRRMRRAVRRGKLQVVREGGKRESLGGGMSPDMVRTVRTLVDGGAEVDGELDEKEAAVLEHAVYVHPWLAGVSQTDEEDPEDTVIRKFKRPQINKVLKELPPREANIIRMRYGLGEKSRPSTAESTLEEVGSQFDVTRERIRQIEAKVLRKLRHPRRELKLRPIMDD